MKTALVTGITGQDGSYLAEFLLGKGYTVHGIYRRASSFNTGRIDHILRDPHEPDARLFIHHGDLADATGLRRILEQVNPDEVYNLGAQSHVRVSFDEPEYTVDIVALGTLRLLESVRDYSQRTGKAVRFYQAGSSEMFGAAPPPQSERTPFYPQSPYAIGKVAGHWFGINHRESYGMFVSNGILFNHESPRRGETFVTRKITRAAGRIAEGLQERLVLGNLGALRDWGYAPEYTEMMWRMLQQPESGDYVCATGEMHSVREFCEHAFAAVGLPLRFEGEGVGEKGVCQTSGRVLVEVSPDYFRPAEVEQLLGDASKAERDLGWTPKVTFEGLVRIMAEADHELARQEKAATGFGRTRR